MSVRLSRRCEESERWARPEVLNSAPGWTVLWVLWAPSGALGVGGLRTISVQVPPCLLPTRTPAFCFLYTALYINFAL